VKEFKELEVDEETLEKLLNLLPFPPEVKRQEAILRCAMKLLGIDKFMFLGTSICHVLAQLLILDADELDAFHFQKQTVDLMTIAVTKRLNEDDVRKRGVMERLTNPGRDRPLVERLLAGDRPSRPEHDQ
jgi:hypothetical protein